MVMQLISEFTIDYNPAGVTEAEKFKSLAVPPFSMLLTANATSYTALVKYNHAEKWMFLTVFDTDGNCIQGETFVAESPVNLLSASDLRGYGLFFNSGIKKFLFYKLNNTKWYNSVDLTEDEAYEVISKKSFLALDE